LFPASCSGERRKAGDNPLGLVALESTVAMLGGLFAAWLFLPVRPGYVFPIAAIAVGTHYAVFKTIYGDRLFWLLGALITAVGLLAIYPVVPLPGRADPGRRRDRAYLRPSAHDARDEGGAHRPTALKASSGARSC
jgi:hypothetical protein